MERWFSSKEGERQEGGVPLKRGGDGR